PADVGKEFLAVVDGTRWLNVVPSGAAGTSTPLLGQSGFKMTGPYDWVAPSYWTLDTTRGGAYGFNTETSPGPAIPTLESLKQMLSPPDLDALWQQPDAKQFHAGLRQFDNLAIFNAALRARYGAPT